MTVIKRHPKISRFSPQVLRKPKGLIRASVIRKITHLRQIPRLVKRRLQPTSQARTRRLLAFGAQRVTWLKSRDYLARKRGGMSPTVGQTPAFQRISMPLASGAAAQESATGPLSGSVPSEIGRGMIIPPFTPPKRETRTEGRSSAPARPTRTMHRTPQPGERLFSRVEEIRTDKRPEPARPTLGQPPTSAQQPPPPPATPDTADELKALEKADLREADPAESQDIEASPRQRLTTTGRLGASPKVQRLPDTQPIPEPPRPARATPAEGKITPEAEIESEEAAQPPAPPATRPEPSGVQPPRAPTVVQKPLKGTKPEPGPVDHDRPEVPDETPKGPLDMPVVPAPPTEAAPDERLTPSRPPVSQPERPKPAITERPTKQTQTPPSAPQARPADRPPSPPARTEAPADREEPRPEKLESAPHEAGPKPTQMPVTRRRKAPRRARSKARTPVTLRRLVSSRPPAPPRSAPPVRPSWQASPAPAPPQGRPRQWPQPRRAQVSPRAATTRPQSTPRPASPGWPVRPTRPLQRRPQWSQPRPSSELPGPSAFRLYSPPTGKYLLHRPHWRSSTSAARTVPPQWRTAASPATPVRRLAWSRTPAPLITRLPVQQRSAAGTRWAPSIIRRQHAHAPAAKSSAQPDLRRQTDQVGTPVYFDSAKEPTGQLSPARPTPGRRTSTTAGRPEAKDSPGKRPLDMPARNVATGPDGDAGSKHTATSAQAEPVPSDAGKRPAPQTGFQTALVQRLGEEFEFGHMGPELFDEKMPGTTEQPAVNIAKLARRVYPLVKRMLQIEKERSFGRTY